MIEAKIYQHSGQSPALGFIVALGAGIILAVFLGFVYNFLIVVIPLVYVNLLITVGFGAVLGYGIKYLSRFSKIRNDRQNIMLAAIVGFIGFYFQWIAYLVFLNSGEHSFDVYHANLNLFYNPLLILDLILQLNKIGSWGMFGVIFTDFPLWVIWGLEASMIIGIPVFITYKHPIIPYSESLNQWYKKYTLNNQFESIAGQNQFRERLLQDAEQTIQRLSYGAANRFAEVSIYYLENEQSQYLSVDNIFIEDNGKGKKNRTSVVHLIEVDSGTAKALMEKYGTKKFALIF